ncbi:hypothetical protein P154DRAFT_522481 [Amniculicola lignicola CBS 123094]|uniref:Tetratricopeptide SHNi-TPR domain-containing protein n=1 Tax=Amniculicola lignicola CBS 123094 TaxID=1392246 RepID=A0A6A5WHR4_9PLEO|nr:hypothetical protein P154DRAFT_522481 [Amniculicola lignicola CBS 123094]
MADTTPDVPRTKEKVTELATAAALQYSLKHYSEAATIYSQACEIQGELNGEMAPENAEIIYQYGRALYEVAIAQNDVLGKKVVEEEKKKKDAKLEPVTESSESAENGAKSEEKKGATAKPYFQLTGDENWTDSEDEEEEADGDAEGEDGEELDEMGQAHHMFELARVLFALQQEAESGGADTDKGKGKAELTPRLREIKKRLADCYSYLVDVSFENGNYGQAVIDQRSGLEMLQEIHSIEDPAVTEAHYKLSLALEYESVSGLREAMGAPAEEAPKEGTVDFGLRKEAEEEMGLAIRSLEARIKKQQEEVGTLSGDELKKKEEGIKDAEDMLEEMRDRVKDLQTDPTKQPIDTIDEDVVRGVLGGILGFDKETQKAKLQEATTTANDISGLVKKKKAKAPVSEPASAVGETSNGKRKLEVDDDSLNGKRAKTEEMQ